ncbi:MAG TPA: hypothetical protein VKE26_12880 [Xanthobacteraceae bacterium]|jgi:hypothetical protein|nr:hypothetical protein [Xanthobacteraceae bacterium]
MTMSEFDTLRADLAALRADIDARIAGLRGDMDVRFARLEAKIDEKPSTATIYQASLTTFAGMFAVMVGTVILLKSISVIP